MTCQICGMPPITAQRGYQTSGGYCKCEIPQRGYMETDSMYWMRQRLMSIEGELFAQKKMLLEIVEILKSPPRRGDNKR